MNVRGRWQAEARLGRGLFRNAVNPSMGASGETSLFRTILKALSPAEPPLIRCAVHERGDRSRIAAVYSELSASLNAKVATRVPRICASFFSSSERLSSFLFQLTWLAP